MPPSATCSIEGAATWKWVDLRHTRSPAAAELPIERLARTHVGNEERGSRTTMAPPRITQGLARPKAPRRNASG
jgi:hypothetical protein